MGVGLRQVRVEMQAPWPSRPRSGRAPRRPSWPVPARCSWARRRGSCPAAPGPTGRTSPGRNAGRPGQLPDCPTRPATGHHSRSGTGRSTAAGRPSASSDGSSPGERGPHNLRTFYFSSEGPSMCDRLATSLATRRVPSASRSPCYRGHSTVTPIGYRDHATFARQRKATIRRSLIRRSLTSPIGAAVQLPPQRFYQDGPLRPRSGKTSPPPAA